MIEKEYPIFAFEEKRELSNNMQEWKSHTKALQIFLDAQKIERKLSKKVGYIFGQVLLKQFRRTNPSFFQVVLYKKYLLLEVIMQFSQQDDLEEFICKIDGSNEIFIEEGQEGLKNIYKLLIKSKKEDLPNPYSNYDLCLADCIRASKNTIQAEKIEQKNQLKVIYKVDI